MAAPDPEFSLGFQEGAAAYRFGAPISVHDVPTKLMWETTDPLYDYGTLHGASCISQRFKDLIERLEPGVHQYFPLEVVDKRGAHLADQWIWVPSQRLDSLDRAKTTMVLVYGKIWLYPRDIPADELPPGYDPTRPVKAVFSHKQIGISHFWRDKFYNFGCLFCSDEAAAVLAAADLIGVGLLKQESV